MHLSETLWLQPSALAPGRARRWLSEWCAHWGCIDIEHDAALLLSELVTNAIQHARTTVTVSARFTGNELRVAVADRQPGDVRGSLPTHCAESGCGLPIVEAIAGSWGVHSHRGGKFVWFTLASGSGPADAGYALAGSRPVRAGTRRGGLSPRR